MNDRYLTPPQYARRIGVKPERVIAWIRDGSLRAIDTSEKPGITRPRYKIPLDAIVAFEIGRTPIPPQRRRRRRRQESEVISFV